MFVLTVDQVDSRHRPDAVPAGVDVVDTHFGRVLHRAPQRTAGDEFQFAVTDPAVALDALLMLSREGHWSTGLGVGTVDLPLADDVRAGTGAAFVAARRAVEAAKRSATRCAVRVATDHDLGDDIGPLLDLLLAVRARRSAEGWEVHDLADQGLTQKAMAGRLGITEQAVSARVRTADLRVEEAARPALQHLLGTVDGGGS